MVAKLFLYSCLDRFDVNGVVNLKSGGAVSVATFLLLSGAAKNDVKGALST